MHVNLTRRQALSGLAVSGLAAGGAAGLSPAPARSAELTYPGVNLSGGEFGDLGRPLGQGYIYPPDQAFAYYASRGLRLVRLPFRIERLQPEPFGALVYHFGNRKLSFLKSKLLVSVVESLEQHPSVHATLTACAVPETQRPAYVKALADLARSQMIERRELPA